MYISSLDHITHSGSHPTRRHTKLCYGARQIYIWRVQPPRIRVHVRCVGSGHNRETLGAKAPAHIVVPGDRSRHRFHRSDCCRRPTTNFPCVRTPRGVTFRFGFKWERCCAPYALRIAPHKPPILYTDKALLCTNSLATATRCFGTFFATCSLPTPPPGKRSPNRPPTDACVVECAPTPRMDEFRIRRTRARTNRCSRMSGREGPPRLCTCQKMCQQPPHIDLRPWSKSGKVCIWPAPCKPPCRSRTACRPNTRKIARLHVGVCAGRPTFPM